VTGARSGAAPARGGEPVPPTAARRALGGAAIAPERAATGAPAVPDAGTEPAAGGEPVAEPPLAVPAERLYQDWREAHARALAYLGALGVPDAERTALAREAVARALDAPWENGGEAVGETLRALGALLPERLPPAARHGDAATDPFLAWRLDAALTDRFRRPAPPRTAGAPLREGRLWSMPPLARASFVPEGLERGLLGRLLRRARGRRPAPPRATRRRLPWIWAALRRRVLLAILVLIPSVLASGFMVNVLPGQGRNGLEVAIVLVFGALFGWISIGFWTALFGFFILLRGRDRFAITQVGRGDAAAGAAAPGAGIDPAARTALVMPICQEPVERVFAGLRAIERSLARAGVLDRFHFFVLSDTRDPATALREEEAWLEWCRASDGFDRIFYRRRRVPLRRKTGNVADFCRRWGTRYRYMIMLDADSVMAGPTLAELVRLMERRPEVGMIQTVPVAVNRRSLLARMQQFAGRVYGPMFAAGLHYWQLGDGQYWGHNAIIRVAPFMRHCPLPRLPGKPPLGGEILSHDFVEAALMGRAGWTIWIAYDLGGSYEEIPGTLLEEMRRDRRWCQGNFQHLRLLFTEGLFGVHRALFLNGVLSYVSAALWFGFLTLSTGEAIRNALEEPEYFPAGRSLFPEWPVWRPDWALTLFAVTLAVLFLPKLLAALLVLFRRRRARAFGGALRLGASVVLEIVLSSLLAPIRMAFHTRFVLANVFGRTVAWRSQERQDTDTGWGDALRRHGLDTAWATAWGASLYWLSPEYFWWITPIMGALVLSVPLSVLTSRTRLGERARALGLFLIPEETDPPPELRDLAELQRAAEAAAGARRGPERDAFARAVADPCLSALHGALRGRPRRLAPALRAARELLVARAVTEGPGALGDPERRRLLADPGTVDDLHRRVWTDPERVRAARWGRPGG
jgi:membrane glycosyltransferase